MLSENLGIRISKKNEIIPNIELKIIKNEVEKYLLDNRLKAKLDNFWWRDEGIWKEKIWWEQRTNSKGAWGGKGKKLQAKDRVCKIICRMDKENTK